MSDYSETDSMEMDEHGMETEIPLHDIRGAFVPQTSTGRHDLPNPQFTMITAIDNGQILDATTNELMAPMFGNNC